jgi:fucose 4-O-acetylase-like acetyltransferase
LKRAQRLLIPYVVWTAIYFVLQTYAPYGKGIEPLTFWDLLKGTGIYVVLWFLPAMFYVSVVGWAIRSLKVRLAVAVLAIALFLVQQQISGAVPAIFAGPYSFALYLAPWLALFLLGQAAASIPPRWLASRQTTVLLLALGVSAAVAAALTCAVNYPAWPGWTPMLLWLTASTASGMVMLLVSRHPRFSFLPAFSRVSLGIYLMHLPLLSLIGRVVPAGIVPWFVWIPVNVVVVVAITGGVCLGIARTPLRFLVT